MEREREKGGRIQGLLLGLLHYGSSYPTGQRPNVRITLSVKYVNPNNTFRDQRNECLVVSHPNGSTVSWTLDRTPLLLGPHM